MLPLGKIMKKVIAISFSSAQNHTLPSMLGSFFRTSSTAVIRTLDLMARPVIYTGRQVRDYVIIPSVRAFEHETFAQGRWGAVERRMFYAGSDMVKIFGGPLGQVFALGGVLVPVSAAPATGCGPEDIDPDKAAIDSKSSVFSAQLNQQLNLDWNSAQAIHDFAVGKLLDVDVLNQSCQWYAPGPSFTMCISSVDQQLVSAKADIDAKFGTVPALLFDIRTHASECQTGVIAAARQPIWNLDVTLNATAHAHCYTPEFSFGGYLGRLDAKGTDFLSGIDAARQQGLSPFNSARIAAVHQDFAGCIAMTDYAAQKTCWDTAFGNFREMMAFYNQTLTPDAVCTASYQQFNRGRLEFYGAADTLLTNAQAAVCDDIQKSDASKCPDSGASAAEMSYGLLIGLLLMLLSMLMCGTGAISRRR